VPDGAEQAVVVEPVDPAQGRYICEAFRRTRSCSNARGTSETVIGERMFAHLVSALRGETGLKGRLTDLFREEIERRKRQEAQIRSLRSKKERLLDAIENGVPMKSVFRRVAEMESEIERLSDLPVLPAVNVSEASIKRRLADALTLAARHIEDPRFAAPIRRFLKQIVERIDLTPIPSQRSGEELRFVLKPDGWVRLYCHIHDDWPALRFQKSAA